MCIFRACSRIVSIMDVPIDASIELPPDIEPATVFPVVSLQVIDDPENAKVEDPPPPNDYHRNMIFP